MVLMAMKSPAASSASRCDRIGLLDRTASLTIRDIRTRECERPAAIVAAAGVELRGMVRERQQVSLEKPFEASPCGVELPLGLFKPPLGYEHVGQTPADLRIAAR